MLKIKRREAKAKQNKLVNYFRYLTCRRMCDCGKCYESHQSFQAFNTGTARRSLANDITAYQLKHYLAM